MKEMVLFMLEGVERLMVHVPDEDWDAISDRLCEMGMFYSLDEVDGVEMAAPSSAQDVA
jgi:hypothetical protein